MWGEVRGRVVEGEILGAVGKLNCKFVAEAVPWPRPLTVEYRVRARISSCVLHGEQIGTGTGFFRVIRFSPVNFITPVSILKYHLGDEERALWFGGVFSPNQQEQQQWVTAELTHTPRLFLTTVSGLVFTEATSKNALCLSSYIINVPAHSMCEHRN
jgi:hypothetical protein